MIVSRKTDIKNIPENSLVRFKEMGNVSEIMYSEKRSCGGYITKLDKNSYVDNRTGEIKDFKHIKNRSEDLHNVSKTLKNGRDIINANITDVSYCRWLTLTYKENMRDTKKLFFDFKNFNKRCRQAYGNYEYIACVEPQCRGAWHLHVILIFDAVAPFMDNTFVREKLWQQGFVNIRKLDNVDNVGLYLTAYLADIELSNDNFNELDDFSIDDIKIVETEEKGHKTSKRIIKGGRLYLYPPGMRIFRYSRGIKKPNVSYLPYKIAKEKAGAPTPTYTNSLSLIDDDKDYSNILIYECYNKLRK